MRKLTEFKDLLYTGYKKLLPVLCLLCGKNNENNICCSCELDLPFLTEKQCERCACLISTHGQLCGNCLRSTPPYDRIFALFAYEMPITELIISLKFQHDLTVAQAFGNLLIQHIKNKWYLKRSLPDIIIPVPLHHKRLRQRGFNQALEIAKPIAKDLSIPLLKFRVKRVKSTVAQSILSSKQRKQNIVHAFSTDFDCTGLTIAVIDDVITTGNTIAEFCKTIKAKGAKRIDVWCCARR